MPPSSTSLASLPNLPQVSCISHAARALDRRQDVHAVWLGGSFARGDADRFSDVDMRIAVGRDDLNAWQEPDWPELLGEAAVGRQLLRFAETSFLHHLILSGGTISVLGASLATRRDILGWIRLVRDEVGSVGRSLAAAHGFAYPQELEQTVRSCWAADEPLLDGADETP